MWYKKREQTNFLGEEIVIEPQQKDEIVGREEENVNSKRRNRNVSSWICRSQQHRKMRWRGAWEEVLL